MPKDTENALPKQEVGTGPRRNWAAPQLSLHKPTWSQYMAELSIFERNAEIEEPFPSTITPRKENLPPQGIKATHKLRQKARTAGAGPKHHRKWGPRHNPQAREQHYRTKTTRPDRSPSGTGGRGLCSPPTSSARQGAVCKRRDRARRPARTAMSRAQSCRTKRLSLPTGKWRRVWREIGF